MKYLTLDDLNGNSCIQLDDDGYCPFLNNDLLCDIYIDLG